MENLQGNDLWILRTFDKLNQFVNTEHVDPAAEFIALSKHINKMTFKNKGTTFRKVYFFLRAVSGEYKKGAESFNAFFTSEQMKKTINDIASEYQVLLAQATA